MEAKVANDEKARSHHWHTDPASLCEPITPHIGPAQAANETSRHGLPSYDNNAGWENSFPVSDLPNQVNLPASLGWIPSWGSTFDAQGLLHVDPWMTQSVNASEFDEYQTVAFPESGLFTHSTVVTPAVFQPIAPAPAALRLLQQQHQAVATPAQIPTSRIPCGHAGCNKTFKSVGDCRRHMRKHKEPTLNCVVVDCDRHFTRMDKLRDHLRQGHKMTL